MKTNRYSYLLRLMINAKKRGRKWEGEWWKIGWETRVEGVYTDGIRHWLDNIWGGHPSFEMPANFPHRRADRTF